MDPSLVRVALAVEVAMETEAEVGVGMGRDYHPSESLEVMAVVI
jgi:hypothetical protein